jgi:N-acetylglutamate synthase-like GNAT family acetyltransferase
LFCCSLQWIKKYFVVEPMDLYQLENPETTIIKEGGEIFFVQETGEDGGLRVVGTCAVIPYGGEGSYEIIKTAVDPNAQRKGYGRKLMERSVLWCKEKKAREIVILSNTVLGPAIDMHKKSGFEVVHLGAHPDYERCNIVLKMNLQ